MNGPDPYDRRLDRLPENTRPHPESAAEAEPPALAVRRDPSQQAVAPSRHPAANGVAWVRPSELAMRVGSPIAGRGIDLQTALTARVRRVPHSIAQTRSRTTRSAIARPTTTSSHEGVEL